MDISVVVPVYNSEHSLRLLAERLEPVLRAHAGQFELILVNDGSRDRSWEVVQELAAAHRWITGINLTRNFGQHSALLCGIRAAQFQVLVTIDDDLQHPPEELPTLLAKLEEGADVVYGTPETQQHGLWRDVASTLTKLSLRAAMGVPTATDVSAFRVFRTTLRDGFSGYHSPFVFIDVLLAWTTTRFASVRVRHEPRPFGESNYTFRKLVVHAVNMATGFSVWPLQLATLIGLGTISFGLVWMVFTLIRVAFFGVPVPGVPLLSILIIVFAGAQLFALGIIGEYLARMHFRTMDRPPFVIREHIGGERPAGMEGGRDG
jgi:glycosyltransferase involved in cell wall biosynthesis